MSEWGLVLGALGALALPLVLAWWLVGRSGRDDKKKSRATMPH